MAILESGVQRRARKATAGAARGLSPERLDQILQHAAQARATLHASLGLTPAPQVVVEPDRAERSLTLVPSHRAEGPVVAAAPPLTAPRPPRSARFA